MSLRQILNEAVGRDLQHLEDNLIVKGSQGALETLNDLKMIADQASTTSKKWDGQAAIYWGHDNAGNFYLIPKTQWEKGQVLSKQDLAKEIQNTGRQKAGQSSSAFRAERNNLAKGYMKLWDVFEKASQGTKGFFKGDIMFDKLQTPDRDGRYRFTPNKVTYVVEPKGLYGKMPTAQAFITVHGKVAPNTNKLVPAEPKEVEMLNRTPGLIALDIQRPSGSIAVDTTELDKAINAVKNDSKSIDAIANYTAPKFTTLKKILYDYSIASGKSPQRLPFNTWLQNSNVSANHKMIINQLQKTPEWATFWKTFDILRTQKRKVYQELNKIHSSELMKKLGISSYVGNKQGGEGYVSSMGKLINPAFRQAEPNPRFAPK